jgi:hypothetical protein
VSFLTFRITCAANLAAALFQACDDRFSGGTTAALPRTVTVNICFIKLDVGLQHCNRKIAKLRLQRSAAVLQDCPGTIDVMAVASARKCAAIFEAMEDRSADTLRKRATSHSALRDMVQARIAIGRAVEEIANREFLWPSL